MRENTASFRIACCTQGPSLGLQDEPEGHSFFARGRRRLAAAHATRHGFSLPDCLATLVIVGVLATAAVATGREHTLRSGRMDAVEALTRIQHEQERHRAQHGFYSTELSALRRTTEPSRQGRYRLLLQRTGAESYTVVATAQGEQRSDQACPTLSLAVDQGVAQLGPNARCWNR
jgi:type IV pilus assembly protein PilE